MSETNTSSVGENKGKGGITSPVARSTKKDDNPTYDLILLPLISELQGIRNSIDKENRNQELLLEQFKKIGDFKTCFDDIVECFTSFNNNYSKVKVELEKKNNELSSENVSLKSQISFFNNDIKDNNKKIQNQEDKIKDIKSKYSVAIEQHNILLDDYKTLKQDLKEAKAKTKEISEKAELEKRQLEDDKHKLEDDLKDLKQDLKEAKDKTKEISEKSEQEKRKLEDDKRKSEEDLKKEIEENKKQAINDLAEAKRQADDKQLLLKEKYEAIFKEASEKSEQEKRQLEDDNRKSEEALKKEIEAVKNKAETDKKASDEKYSDLNHNYIVLLDEKKALLEKYAKFERLHDCYNRLSDDVKKSCQSYFGNGDITSILFNIVNRDKIESFWQYIADNIKGNKLLDSQIEIVKEIFDIAFELFQTGNSDFVRIVVNEGEEDKPSIMQKTSDSRQIGSVKKVLLNGYKMVSNNRVIKKSLIFLG